MLLNNFYQMLRVKCGITTNDSYKVTCIDETIGTITTNSSTVANICAGLVKAPLNSYINYPGLGSSNTAYPVVILSTDTTEPQRTDATMTGVLTTNDLELYGCSFGYNNSNMATYSVTAKNTTAENITVNKVGLMITSTSLSANYAVLVYEELLAEPVTLASNDIYTFTVQIG